MNIEYDTNFLKRLFSFSESKMTPSQMKSSIDRAYKKAQLSPAEIQQIIKENIR